MPHGCHRFVIRRRGNRAAFPLIFAALGGSCILLSLSEIALAQFKMPDHESARFHIAGSAGVNAPAKTVNEAYYEGGTGVVGGIPHLIHAGAGSLAAAFAQCPGGRTPSNMCTVEIDPGQTYSVPSALIIGSDIHPQTLLCMGGAINCTDRGGAGHACLVIADKGHLKAPTGGGAPAAGQGCQVSSNSTTNIDSLVESYAAYAYSTLGTKVQQANFDVESINIVPNPMMAGLKKAALWISAIDGDAWVSHIYIGPGPTGSTGVLIDDAPTGSRYSNMYWNNLNFIDVWVGMGNDAYAVKVRCGMTSGSGGANLTWIGGAMVDGTNPANVAELNVDGGRSGTCAGILLQNIYFESRTGQAGDYIELKGVSSFVAHSLIFNGGPPLTNCILISGTPGDQIHADGRAATGTRCTNVINNAINNYQDTTQGAFDYTYSQPNTNPYTNYGAQPLMQIGGLLNPFGPGGQGLYYSAAGTALPPCTSGLARYFACVSDSTACTSGRTYAQGGSAGCLVQCNNRGNAWKETGVPCF